MTRTHLIAGACLLCTGLVLGTVNGAIAAAEPDGPSSSESAQTTGDLGSEGDAGDTAASPPAEQREGEDEDEDDHSSSTVAAQSDESDDVTATDTALPDVDESPSTDTVTDPPAPVSSASSSEALDPAPSPPVFHTPEPVAPTIAEPSFSEAAAIEIPILASVPEAVANPDPAVPSAVTPVLPPMPPALPAAPVAPPLLGEAVAQLMRTLVFVTVDVVDAVLRLIIDLRVTLGIPWAQQGGSGMYPQSALLKNDALVGLLTKLLLSRSSGLGVGSSILGGVIDAAVGLGQTLTPTSTLDTAARSLVTVRHPDRALAQPAQPAVTALAAMSLWALLSGALPGLGGLLVVGATGVRIGYRQARGRIALHTMEFVRFARSGPIGVVRTGAPAPAHTRTAPADITLGHPHLRLAS